MRHLLLGQYLLMEIEHPIVTGNSPRRLTMKPKTSQIESKASNVVGTNQSKKDWKLTKKEKDLALVEPTRAPC